MPAWLLPAAALALNAGGTAANMLAQGKMNKKTRQWNEKMYGLQRQHALDDYHMQNEYNHPSSQMERLKAAGLNPNLVYGNGADAQGGTVRSSDMQSWNPRAPQVDTAIADNALSQYYDIQAKTAQIDNLRVQNTVLAQEAILKAAQTAGTNASTAKTGVDVETGKFNLGLAQELRQTSLEAAKANLDKMAADTKSTLDENTRRSQAQGLTLAKAAEDILNSRSQRANNESQRRLIEQQIRNLREDETLKRLDINLKRLGIQPSDPAWQRALSQLLSNLDAGKVTDIVPKVLGNKPLPKSMKKYGGVAPFGIPK